MGWRVYTIRNSKRAVVQSHSGKGWPDVVLVRGATILYRELKRERGRVSVEQAGWLDALREAGQDAGVWRPGDWLDGTIERSLR